MPKVLVVDSDKSILTAYEECLKEDGYKVIKAFDGQEALNKFNNDKFDLVIADINLPKVTGKKFVDQLQGPSLRMSCPLVIYTEKIDPALQKVFNQDSKIHFLQKPFDKVALQEKLNSLNKKTPDVMNTNANKKVDVRVINPVLESTMKVLKELTNFEIAVGRPFLKTDNEPSGDISGIVGIVSTGFKGTISLSFPEAGYLKIVSTMLGEDYKEINDENKDAVAEILNMVFGLAKTTLNETGMNIKSAIPTVIRGPQHSIQHHANNPTIVIPFSSPQIGPFRSEVSSSPG